MPRYDNRHHSRRHLREPLSRNFLQSNRPICVIRRKMRLNMDIQHTDFPAVLHASAPDSDRAEALQLYDDLSVAG